MRKSKLLRSVCVFLDGLGQKFQHQLFEEKVKISINIILFKIILMSVCVWRWTNAENSTSTIWEDS